MVAPRCSRIAVVSGGPSSAKHGATPESAAAPANDKVAKSRRVCIWAIGSLLGMARAAVTPSARISARSGTASRCRRR